MDSFAIGLTQFMDFVIRGSSARVTLVKQIKYQEPYHPAKDFWKLLRDEIKDIHSGGHSLDRLDRLIDEIHDKKIAQYVEAIKQYKKFCRGKKIEWFDVGESFWAFDRLVIRSTPELGLIIDGIPYKVKLYFKEHRQPLDKRRAEALLTLMQESFSKKASGLTKSAVLNVKKARLIPLDKPITTNMRLAIEADAAAFIHLWDKV